MRTARQIVIGLLIALASIGIVLGGISLSFAEGGLIGNAPASLIPPSPTEVLITPVLITDTPLIIATEISLTPTWTFTPPPTPVNCPPPTGWHAYPVQIGDSLDALASRFHTTAAAIVQANCLSPAILIPGSVIYLPPAPTATPIPCGPEPGWVIYVVKQGDTLYHISQLYNITVSRLQLANCLGTTTINTGQRLYVPPWAPHTATPTITPMPTFTDTPTTVPTETPTDTPTDTLTPIPTNTPTPSDTPVTPTSTP